MLYLVATPIGNLADMSQRAIDVLKSCDYILCEDTRHSSTLLNHYEIRKPLKSFHKFNESAKETSIIDDLEQGKIIGLISDAGTPGIADPGSALVHECVIRNISVIAIPGACAAIQALSCSGLDTNQFQFYGFLPRKAGELRHCLQGILRYQGTTICYESPQRLVDTIACLKDLAPDRQIVTARELTKKFEEIKRGTASQLFDYWKDREVKGELVILIAGDSTQNTLNWESLKPIEHVEFMESTYHLSRQEAIKLVADMRGVPKRNIYNEIVKDR